MSEIYSCYERRDGRGLAGYHPEMLTRLLLYGYASGESSSRRIEQATYDNVAFRYLAADQHPDHDTIASFRRKDPEGLSGLFVQALRLCQKAGLVKLGHVAIDGTKLQANASTNKSMSYGTLSEQRPETSDCAAPACSGANVSPPVKTQNSTNGALSDGIVSPGSSRRKFKLAAVRRLEQGISIAEVARGLEVNPNVLHR